MSNRVLVRIVLGHESFLLDEPTEHGFTHKWTMFVRPVTASGYKTFTDRNFIRKVEFKLHETFPNPHRILKEPPFEITEHGFGSFSLPITFHFNAPGTKSSFTTVYDLTLSMEKYARNAQDFVCELRDVNEAFMDQIAKYCPAIKKKKRISEEIESPPPPIIPPKNPKIGNSSPTSEFNPKDKEKKKKKGDKSKLKEEQNEVATKKDKEKKKSKFLIEMTSDKLPNDKSKTVLERDKGNMQKTIHPKEESLSNTTTKINAYEITRPESGPLLLSFPSSSKNDALSVSAALPKPSPQKPQAPVKTAPNKKEKSITDSSPSMMTSSSSERSSVSPRQPPSLPPPLLHPHSLSVSNNNNINNNAASSPTATEIAKQLLEMKDENVIYRVCEYLLTKPSTASMLNASEKLVTFNLSHADSDVLLQLQRLLSDE